MSEDLYHEIVELDEMMTYEQTEQYEHSDYQMSDVGSLPKLDFDEVDKVEPVEETVEAEPSIPEITTPREEEKETESPVPVVEEKQPTPPSEPQAEKPKEKHVHFADQEVFADEVEAKKKVAKLKIPQRKLLRNFRVKIKDQPLAPTYRIYTAHYFDPLIVHALVQKVLSYYLTDDVKFPKTRTFPYLLSTTIRDAIKGCEFDRYKTIVILDFIEKYRVNKCSSRPSYISGYRVLFDNRHDSVVINHCETKNLVVSSIVYGFFLE